MSSWNKEKTSFYHDYETSGADTKRDRPVQFAGIRVDESLNTVDVFDSIYCKLPDDVLPHPMAFVVTQMMIDEVQELGMPEFEFAHQVLNQLGRSNTTSLGYNTIAFDDEMTRNLFHRNLINPYEREWKNGNSRWDLINVVRMAAAIFSGKIYEDGSNIFNVPLNDDGKKSFRLEDLSVANGIEHENAHDALSDVYATIGMAKIINDKEPEFFSLLESRKSKNLVSEDFINSKPEPILLCSSFFGGERSYVSFVIPLCVSSKNKNEVYCVKLESKQDIANLIDFTVEDITKLIFEKSDVLKENGLTRPALTTVRINACPVYLTTNDIKNIYPDTESREAFYKSINVNTEDLAEAYRLYRSNIDILVEKARGVFDSQNFESNPDEDVDLTIYSGGFPSNEETMLKNSFNNDLKIAKNDEDRLNVFNRYLEKSSGKIKEQIFRVAFRSYPDVAVNLGEKAVKKWHNHCYERINGESDAVGLNYESFLVAVEEIRANEKYSDPLFEEILSKLEVYAKALSEKYSEPM